MHAKITILTALLAVAPMAQAGESVARAGAGAGPSVAELARESGLSERKVRMLLGSRTPYAEYRPSYNRALRQFKEAVGDETYERLASQGYVPKARSRIAAHADQDKDAMARVGVSAL